jgi:hypothetical protein
MCRNVSHGGNLPHCEIRLCAAVLNQTPTNLRRSAPDRRGAPHRGRKNRTKPGAVAWLWRLVTSSEAKPVRNRVFMDTSEYALRPSSLAMWLGRIDLVSERGRGRSCEQATTPTTAACEPLNGLTFLVENMECHEADIGNFILAERNFLTHYCVSRRRIRSRPGCFGHSARERQRQSGRSQNRYGFAALRGLFHARHLNSPGQ